MPHRRADAVITGVTTTNDNNVFTPRADIGTILQL
jgi:hypothetical protein